MSDVWTPPQAEVKDLGVSGNPDAPEIRRAHLSHEANIRSIGFLYYFASVMTIVAAIGILVAAAVPGPKADNVSMGFIVFMGVLCLGLGVLNFWVARGLRTLKSSAKVTAGVLSGIGLLGFPIWTLINAYILYLLFSQKGTMVFSDEYKQIIADTPDIKYRTSIIVWIILALLFGLTIAMVVASGH